MEESTRPKESYDIMMKDSNRVFKTMSTSGFKTYKEAEQAVVVFYFTDMSYSRAGICHALKRLEKFYEEKQ